MLFAFLGTRGFNYLYPVSLTNPLFKGLPTLVFILWTVSETSHPRLAHYEPQLEIAAIVVTKWRNGRL